MSAKNKIIDKFNRTLFQVNDRTNLPLDEEIEGLIYKINKRKTIITVLSCAGHSKEEKNSDQDHTPYIAFVVNEAGWRTFWTVILPEICGKTPVITYISTNSYNACAIVVRAENYSDKNVFWESITKGFLTHFK